MYSCDAKLNILASLLQSSESHNLSEIILMFRFSAQETVLFLFIYYMYVYMHVTNFFFFLLFFFFLILY